MQRITEIFGKKWKMGLIYIGKICCKVLWHLKSSLAGSNGKIFSFLRLNAGFGHVLVSYWDQTDELCRLSCFGDGKWGMSPCQVPQVQPVCWVAGPTTPSACSIPQGGEFGNCSTQVCFSLGWASASQPWWLWAQGSVSCEDSWIILVIVVTLSHVMQFPLPHGPLSKLKVNPHLV